MNAARRAACPSLRLRRRREGQIELRLLATRTRARDTKHVRGTMKELERSHRRAEPARAGATDDRDLFTHLARQSASKRVPFEASNRLGVARDERGAQRVEVAEQRGLRLSCCSLNTYCN